jgi:hypothetical protein
MLRNSLQVEGIGPTTTNTTEIMIRRNSRTFPVKSAKNATDITMSSVRVLYMVSVEGFSGGSALFLLLLFLGMTNPFS